MDVRRGFKMLQYITWDNMDNSKKRHCPARPGGDKNQKKNLTEQKYSDILN